MRKFILWLICLLTADCLIAQTVTSPPFLAPATVTTSAPSLNITQPSCGTSTGIIKIIAPLPPTGIDYYYSINGGASRQNSLVYPNLAAGTYSVIAYDDNGIASPATSVTINPLTATPATPTTTFTSPATCGALGTITVTSPIGANITYSIDGTIYQTSPNFTSVVAGTYHVTAKDGNSCVSPSFDVTIAAPPAAPSTPTASVTTQPTCAIASGTITVTAPLGANYVYSVDGITYQASTVFTGLVSANYNVTVKDIPSGCISSFLSLTVNAQPTTPTTPVVAVTQPTCSTATGTLVVSAQNATDSYSFDNGVTFQVGNSKTALSPGTYDVIIKSTGGCTSPVTTSTINAQPSTPTAPAITIIQPSCGTPTGTITVTPQIAGETYSFDSGVTYQATNVKAGLNPNSYDIMIKSAGGCTSAVTTGTINASASTPSTPVLTIKQPTCTLPGEIAVTLQTAGETYSFDNGVSYQASNIKAGLTAGTYNIIIKSAGGCNSAVTSGTINAQPTTPTTPVVNATQPNCGTPSGTLTVTPQIAGEIYSFDNGVSYQASNIKVGLTAGTYNIIIKSAGGCTSAVTSATINTSPIVPTTTVVSITQPTCAIATGTITVTLQTAGETYSFDNGATFQASNTKAGLSAGIYQVIIQSISGCNSAAIAVTINTPPTTPSAPVITIIQPSCGTPTGTITVTTQIAGETYSFDGGATFQASNIKTGLATGLFNVIIKSAGGCISTMTPATISTAPSAPTTPVVSITQPTCATATGTITVTIQNASDTYSVDNGATYQSSNIKAALAAGTYNVIIKRVSGCISATTPAIVNTQPLSPAIPVISIIQPTCSTSTGTCTVTIQNASDTYSYDNGATFQASNIKAGLVVGSYTIIIKNLSGCTATAMATVNAQPPTPATPVTTVTQPTCASATGTIAVTSPIGLNYSIDGVSYTNTTGTFAGLAVGSYPVTAKNSSGCISASSSVTIIESIPAIPTVSAIQPTCLVSTGTVNISAPTGAIYSYSINGTTFQSGTAFNNVTPATYTVSVKNTNSGCISTKPNIAINAQPATPNAPNVTLTQPNCLIATGTITVTDPLVAGTTFSIDGATYSNTTGIFSSLAVGVYPVTAKNSNGCISASTQDTILSPIFTLPKSDFTLSTYSIDNKHNSVSGSITPETNVSYLWDLGDGSPNITGSDMLTHYYNIIGNEGEIIVTLTATDLIGCNSTTSKSIAISPFIPNVFTPNGDAYNEYFMPGFEMQLFDRHGILIYQGIAGGKGWDGTYKGQNMDPDTYFYILHYIDSKKNILTKKGYITLIR